MGVEVLSVIRVEEEVAAAYSGDNIKLKLKGVEEEVSEGACILITNLPRFLLLFSLLGPFVPPSLPPSLSPSLPLT